MLKGIGKQGIETTSLLEVIEFEPLSCYSIALLNTDILYGLEVEFDFGNINVIYFKNTNIEIFEV